MPFQKGNTLGLSHGYARRGHKTPEYLTWEAMKRRCYNPSQDNFVRYGGQGITVCDRWLRSFETFLGDMGSKPSPEHSLDRINSAGNYEPSNCRWATRSQQMKNRRPFYRGKHP